MPSAAVEDLGGAGLGNPESQEATTKSSYGFLHQEDLCLTVTHSLGPCWVPYDRAIHTSSHSKLGGLVATRSLSIFIYKAGERGVIKSSVEAQGWPLTVTLIVKVPELRGFPGNGERAPGGLHCLRLVSGYQGPVSAPLPMHAMTSMYPSPLNNSAFLKHESS